MLGSNPAGFLVQTLTEQHEAFERAVFWTFVLAALTFLLHLPAVAWARHQSRHAKREHRRRYVRSLKRRRHDHAERRAHHHQHRFEGNRFTAVLMGMFAGGGAFDHVSENQQLDDEIETVFLMADVSLQPIASKLVKEIALYGGDISSFVSPSVRDDVVARVEEIGVKGDY